MTLTVLAKSKSCKVTKPCTRPHINFRKAATFSVVKVLAAERELSREIEAVKNEVQPVLDFRIFCKFCGTDLTWFHSNLVFAQSLLWSQALAIEPSHDPQGIVSEAVGWTDGLAWFHLSAFWYNLWISLGDHWTTWSGHSECQAMQLVVRYGDKIWDKFPEPAENAPGGCQPMNDSPLSLLWISYNMIIYNIIYCIDILDSKYHILTHSYTRNLFLGFLWFHLDWPLYWWIISGTNRIRFQCTCCSGKSFLAPKLFGSVEIERQKDWPKTEEVRPFCFCNIWIIPVVLDEDWFESSNLPKMSPNILKPSTIMSNPYKIF